MRHIHLIGIGGSGMSAIARLLLEEGYTVSGSDRADSSFIDDLRKLNATISIGHDPANITGADLIIQSSAIPEDNPEITAAIEKGIPVLKRAEFLGSLMVGKTGVGIAGTHGKTTTSAMLAWVLTELKQDPSFILGGVSNNLGVNAHFGQGDVFVIEADEYDRMFLGLNPKIEVITNVEHDHPDCYPTIESFLDAFKSFVALLDEKGRLILNGNDKNAAILAKEAAKKNIPVTLFGIPHENSPDLDIFASDIVVNTRGGFSYSTSINQDKRVVHLQVPGIHNVVNSLAVLSVVNFLKLPLDNAIKALANFQGTARRFEVCGEYNGITLINDYAHHPTEIRATLAAAKSRHPNHKVWAVWQPHTYSRTQLLISEFSNSFQDADHVIVTEIFAARELKKEFSSSKVVAMMDHPDACFIAEINDVAGTLINELKPGDILLVLSAGDADQICNLIMNHYRKMR